MRFLQQRRALFVDNLPGLGNRVIDRSLQFAVLIGANELHAPGFAIDVAADVTRGTVFTVFVYGSGFDRETLVFHRLGRRS